MPYAPTNANAPPLLVIISPPTATAPLPLASKVPKEQLVVLEKNATIGGRARQLLKNGFTFDIGPTWYWMPDVFEKFFSDFNKKPSDFYELEKLSPGYQVYFDTLNSITIPDSLEEIYQIFEEEEQGSSVFLKQF